MTTPVCRVTSCDHPVTDGWQPGDPLYTWEAVPHSLGLFDIKPDETENPFVAAQWPIPTERHDLDNEDWWEYE
jgi:hypothetical protein